MKTRTVLFFLIFVFAKTYTQNYQISFAGTGASSIVDSVKVENLTQCTSINLSGSDILHLVATLGVDNINTRIENAFDIYPNPMTDICLIEFEATNQGNTIIELYNIIGKRILQTQEFLCKGYHSFRLSGINFGIYSLKIESDKYSYSSKIISTNSTYNSPEIKHISTIPFNDNKSADSNTINIKNLKSNNSIIEMQYNTGDRLKLTGKSGNYRTVYILIPTVNQTVTFNYVACTDADNNNYAVVQIGTQIWMAENLKTTKYRNGNQIPNITDGTAWNSLTTGAYCDYNNTTSNSAIYGKLYNWYTVNDARNIAPLGWHVATNGEWFNLNNYLGGTSNSGGKLKENCNNYWLSTNVGATNESGFTALPGGYRNNDGTFGFIGSNGNWWCSTSMNSAYSYSYLIINISIYVTNNYNNKKDGFSVRCIKD